MNVFKNLLKLIFFCKIGIHFWDMRTDKLREGDIYCRNCDKDFEDGRY